MIRPMVHLDRIYTRSGDDGSTGLGDGKRLPKHHPRIAAYGTTDELSSVIGLALSNGVDEPWYGCLRGVQNDLFDVGADLCFPSDDAGALRVTDAYTAALEKQIDEANEALDEDPALVNSSPEEDGWFFKLTIADKGELDGLMDADAYKSFCDGL